MTITAILLPVVIGFAGLGLDMTHIMMERRALQSLADSAALMSVHTVADDMTDPALFTRVVDHLSEQGFDATTDTLTITDPPSSGVAVGLSNYMEITISRQVQMAFASIIWDSATTVATRAVAGKVIVGEGCIVALEETADRALYFTGTADVNADCGVATNSSSAEAIYVGGRAELTADLVMAFGGVEVAGAATLTTESPVQEFSSKAVDPYGAEGDDLQIPPVGACDYGAVTAGDDAVMLPGRYCGDLTVQGSNVSFSPGVYIIDGGDFVSNANSDMYGDGVTFILTASDPANVGNIRMNGSTTADFTAPALGEEYAGILFFQDPAATEYGASNVFNGGSNLLFDGVLYFPNQEVTFTGGANFSPACMQIIGKSVKFTGSSVIKNDEAVCASLGLKSVMQIRVQLVE